MAIHERRPSHILSGSQKGFPLMMNIIWKSILADESQRFRNPRTICYKAMMCLIGRYKLCLTGTPIANYTTDIWSQLRWMGYNGVIKSIEWKRRGMHIYREQNLNRCIMTLRYGDTNIKLPERHSYISTVTLSGRHLDIYYMILNIAQKAYNMYVRGLDNYHCILAVFIRLRQCCIAPYLMTPISKRKKNSESNLGATIKPNKSYEEELYRAIDQMNEDNRWVFDPNTEAGIKAVKMINICYIIRDIPIGEKVVIFSKFTSSLDLVERTIGEYLSHINMIKVDGDVVGPERNRALDTFDSDDSIQVMLISYDVGSEGLTLTVANHVILFIQYW